jgi:hypothetical protein
MINTMLENDGLGGLSTCDLERLINTESLKNLISLAYMI